jgi:hypothetical protein
VHVCISSTEGLGAWPGRDRECLWIPSLKGSSEGEHGGLRGGSLGSTALAQQRSRAGGSEISRGLACIPGYSFSIWWLGEDFHELGVQGADVSALPGALPQSRCLQLLIKVHGSWKSEGLWLCSGHRLGSLHCIFNFFPALTKTFNRVFQFGLLSFSFQEFQFDLFFRICISLLILLSYTAFSYLFHSAVYFNSL